MLPKHPCVEMLKKPCWLQQRRWLEPGRHWCFKFLALTALGSAHKIQFIVTQVTDGASLGLHSTGLELGAADKAAALITSAVAATLHP